MNFFSKTPSFIKLPSNKRFEFKPRFYNATKEELEARKERVLREIKLEEKMGTENWELRNKFQDNWSAKSRRKNTVQSNKRILLITAILSMLAYYFLYK
jgi:hypothetical protein